MNRFEAPRVNPLLKSLPKRSAAHTKAALVCQIECLESRQLLTNSPFVHPGILNTATDFQRMVSKVSANAQPWLSDWNNLKSAGYAQLGASPRPLVTVVRASTGSNYTQMYIDIERAYDTALEWKVSGDTRYADQTVTFLNAWASTNTSITGDSNASLAYGLYGFQWANIAEMMRSYSGWAAADQTQFQNYLLNVYIPGNQDLLVNHHGTDPTHYWANWDLCNIGSEMAIGIFCDRHDLYDNALNYLYTGIGNGALDKAIYYIHAGNLGQGQEAGRDQGHAGLDFALLGQICQTAWNQGDDLFSYHNNEILAGVEYLAKYNLGNDVPFVTYASSTGGTETAVSSGSRGQLRPIFELFYSHYVTMEGLSAPYTTQALMQHTRPEGDNGNGDEYSWGTLIFALDPVAAVQPPKSLVGYQKGTGNIQLNWWGGANDNTYNVYRATSSSGPFTRIASGITVFTYTDSNLPAGTYYYKVTGVNGTTETAATNIVSATSTNAPVSQLKFDESSGGTASDSVGSLTGTLNGGATFAPGKSGNAVSLDGSSGYVSLPAGAIANVSDFTIATWVYLNSSQTWARIFDFGDARGEWMMLTPKNGSGNLEFATSTAYNYNKQSVDGPPLAINQWAHLAVTFSSRLATLYVNGIAVASNANMDFPPYEINGGMPNSWIGRSQYSADPYLNGKVDDFRIYRGALPAGQVYTLATGNAAPAVPAAPASFTATAVPGNTINLSWSTVSGATSYSVYRSSTSGGPYLPVATLITATSYSDTGLAADTPYYYVVAAANTGGEGPASAQSTATARPPLPSVPTALVARGLTSSSISLNWTASANDYTYTIRRATTSGGPYTTLLTGLNATTYTDSSVTNGTTYYYIIAGDNTAGESANSNEDAATPTDLFVHLKFDDGSGATAYDASGNGWNGTLVNSPTWTTAGKVNTALTLASASSQYVSLPNGVVAGQTAFTISAWVYLTTSTTWMRVFDFGTGTSNYMFLSVHNGSNVPRFAILVNGASSGEQGINGTNAIPIGAWTHMAVTLTPNVGSSPQTYTGTLYINGASIASNPGITWTPNSLGTTTQNYIGRSEWSSDPYLNGSVDDFRIYAHALTAAQISALVNPTPTTITVSPNPTTMAANSSRQFTATVLDQFGNTISSPSLTWSATGGSITSSGMFTAAQTGGNFNVTATSGSAAGSAVVNVVPTLYPAASGDGFYLRLAPDGVTEQIWAGTPGAVGPSVGNPNYTILLNQLSSLSFGAGSSVNGMLTIDASNGSPIPSGGIGYDGGAGSDSLVILGTSGNDNVAVNASQVLFGNTPITYANIESIQVNLGSGLDTLTQSAQPGNGASLSLINPTSADTLVVTAGAFTFPAPAVGAGIVPLNLNTLSVGSGARVVLKTAVSHADRTVLKLNMLNLAGSTGAWLGTLDLGGNDAIIHNGSLTNITNQLKQGFNSPAGYGNGVGIISSAAQANTSYLTTLGAIQNLNTAGTAVAYATFDGVGGLTTSDVLMKYTYYGDADLSGSPTANDYTIIDAHNGTTTGASWSQGDFDADGKVDGSDYSLIDNAFNMQGSNGLANPMSLVTAVPSPTTVSAGVIDDKKVISIFSRRGLTNIKRTIETGGYSPALEENWLITDVAQRHKLLDFVFSNRKCSRS